MKATKTTRAARVFSVLFQRMGLGTLCLLAGLPSCRSAPYQSGSPAEVAFIDYHSGLHLVLQNESLTPKEVLYGQQKEENASIKVISDPLMEYLLDEMASEGYFEEARTSSAPRGAYQNLQTRLGSARYDFGVSHPRESPVPESFQRMVEIFRNIYDNTFQAQIIEGDGKELFEAKRKELEWRRQERGEK